MPRSLQPFFWYFFRQYCWHPHDKLLDVAVIVVFFFFSFFQRYGTHISIIGKYWPGLDVWNLWICKILQSAVGTRKHKGCYCAARSKHKQFIDGTLGKEWVTRRLLRIDRLEFMVLATKISKTFILKTQACVSLSINSNTLWEQPHTVIMMLIFMKRFNACLTINCPNNPENEQQLKRKL